MQTTVLSTDFINCDILGCNNLTASTLDYITLKDVQTTTFSAANLDAENANITNLNVTGTSNITAIVPKDLTCNTITTKTLDVTGPGTSTIAEVEATTATIKNFIQDTGSTLNISNLNTLTCGTVNSNVLNVDGSAVITNFNTPQATVGQLTINSNSNNTAVVFDTVNSGVQYQFNVNNANVASFSTESANFIGDLNVTGNLSGGGLNITTTDTTVNIVPKVTSNTINIGQTNNNQPVVAIPANAAVAINNTLNVSGTSTVLPTGQSVCVQANSLQGGIAVSCLDNATNNGLFISPDTNQGNFNPLVPNHSAAIVSYNAVTGQANQGMILCPYSPIASGVIINPAAVEIQNGTNSISVNSTGTTIDADTTFSQSLTVNGDLTVTGDLDVTNLPTPQSITVTTLNTTNLTATNATISNFVSNSAPFYKYTLVNNLTPGTFTNVGPPLYAINIYQPVTIAVSQNMYSTDSSGVYYYYNTAAELVWYPVGMQADGFSSWYNNFIAPAPSGGGGTWPNTSAWQHLQLGGSQYQYVIYTSQQDNTRAFQQFGWTTTNNVSAITLNDISNLNMLYWLKAFGTGTNQNNASSFVFVIGRDSNNNYYIQVVQNISPASPLGGFYSNAATLSGLINVTSVAPTSPQT